MQRLYLGNLKVGSHELVAFFTGKGPNNRDYRRGASVKFAKSIGAKYLRGIFRGGLPKGPIYFNVSCGMQA